MTNTYILTIDQSTQGTKVLLIDNHGRIFWKNTLNHRQIINDKNWISHDLNEIEHNLIQLINQAIQVINPNLIIGVAITNQRETAAAWSKKTGLPLTKAIVWQCARAKDVIKNIITPINEKEIKDKTGLQPSPYFSAAKFSWMLQEIPEVKQAQQNKDLAFGTIDSWLLYQLTNKQSFKTEISNACRTQLLNIHTGMWDLELCKLFGINLSELPTIVDSNSNFGTTNLFGLLDHKIPILSILGDSQAALFAHNCLTPGDFKVTFGTGSSVMINIGETLPKKLPKKLNLSLAWSLSGHKNYVLEGNITYAGATITWLKDNLNLIQTPDQTQEMALQADVDDTTYFIPAFDGLGSPYWISNIQAGFVGINRKTGKNELVKACLDSIIYQIYDILTIFSDTTNIADIIRVDGEMTKNQYLMQTLSNFSQKQVIVSNTAELSALGTALNALSIANNASYTHKFLPDLKKEEYHKKIALWHKWIHCLNQK